MTALILEFFQNNVLAIHIVHLALAIALFFIVNWIGRNSISVGYIQMSIALQEDTAPAFNYLFKVLAPVVYLILCAVLFQSVHLDILVDKCYFIVIYYWAFRFLWNLTTNRWKLTNWLQLILYWASSIGLSFWIYSNIKDVKNILPTGDDLIGEMWILIIAFLYSVFNKLNFGEARAIRRKDNYIESRYKKFKSKYDSIIHPFFSNPFYEALTYSIMIYEDFNRPYAVRLLEYVVFYITKKPHTLGIMQVTTNRYIDNKESVRLAIRKIARDNNAYINQVTEERARSGETGNPEIHAWMVIDHIVNQYNGGDSTYSDEINTIFNKLIQKHYPNALPTHFSIIRED